MATIIKDIPIDAKPGEVWDALEDFGALHTRLVPGFVTACDFDGEARNITFSNGTTAREHLVTSDAAKRRLVYAIIGQRIKHYSASAQVFDDGDKTRLIWTVDMLPDDIAPYISEQMDLGAAAMQRAFAKKAA